MASRSRGPGWRDEAAAALLLRLVAPLPLKGPVLVMEEFRPEVLGGFREKGLETAAWSRRAVEGFPATPWPPAGPFQTATLRLPRSRESLLMALHAASASLEAEGMVLVYGAKDEGIASAVGPMEALFQGVSILGVGGHCRVLEGNKMGRPEGLKATLADWRERWIPEGAGLPESLTERWVSYPGVFAHGRLDPGTKLLLTVIPDFPSGAKVLDYGCGSGIIGGVALARNPSLNLHLLDVDTVALEAARENVPGGNRILGDGLGEIPSSSFDFVLSNPPFHRGKEEDPEMLKSFVREGARVLRPDGTLTFVTQRRIPLQETMEAVFREVTLLARDGTFAVWQGRIPPKSTRGNR